MNLAAYRRNRWTAFFITMLTATLFVASPITSFAHLLAAHALAAVQFDGDQEAPHAPLCKLCLGFVAGSAAADNYVPSHAVVLLPQQSPETSSVGPFRPVPYALYIARAPPIL